MPLFIDVQTVGRGASAQDLVQVCETESAGGGRFGVTYLRYWVSEPAGKVFCLVEADSPDLVPSRHGATPGLVSREIYPVSEHVRWWSGSAPTNSGSHIHERG